MPGSMNGFGFAQWARSVRPGLKIILAASPERATHAAAELTEHAPLLMKPYDPKIASAIMAQVGRARNFLVLRPPYSWLFLFRSVQRCPRVIAQPPTSLSMEHPCQEFAR
jgi:hypothetical protein